MRIGELGRLAGVTTKTIRYYEEIGLLAEPVRTDAGYRDYEPAMADRLVFIKDAQATGLSLDEIASIVSLRDHGEQTCDHVLSLLEGKIADIDARLRRLRETRKLLVRITQRARTLDPSDCLDPHRCQVIGGTNR